MEIFQETEYALIVVLCNIKKPEEPKIRRGKPKVFSDEEILLTGLHPDDEGYKMSLISRILGGK